MTRHPRPHAAEYPRRAFTLVELLVVIAIIIILMSLTLVVISRIWRKIDDTATQVDISRMQQDIEQFKSAFGRYPPGRLLLYESSANWQAALSSGDAKLAQLAAESVDFLQAAFPGIELQNPAISHDWSGRAQHPVVNNNFTGLIPANPNGVFLLEGSEVMVYLLGGMRYGLLDTSSKPNFVASAKNRTGALGWNTNKQRPCAPPPLTGGPGRLGPFHAFDESRINYAFGNPTGREWNSVPVAALNNLCSQAYFPVYLDRYERPYLYFRAAGAGVTNNYRYVNSWYTQLGGGNYLLLLDNPKTLSDMGSPNFVPYWENCTPPQPAVTVVPPNLTTTKFFKADRFQIISAGRDQLFGTGGRYDPANPEQYLTSTADFDNITNITEGPIKP